MPTTETEARAEQVLLLPGKNRYSALAHITCSNHSDGWWTSVSYSYGNGGGGSNRGPFTTREAAILEAVENIDRGIPREGGGFWPVTPQADRVRIG